MKALLERLRLRRARRALVVWIRRLIHLDEDDIRDQLVDGLRRDLDATNQHAGNMMNLIEMLAANLNAQAAILNRWRKESATLAMIEDAHQKKLRRQAEAEARENGTQLRPDLHIVGGRNGKSDQPIIEVVQSRIITEH